MKNSLACPKCESRKLWRIEKLRVADKDNQRVFHRPILLALGRKLAKAPTLGTLERIWHGPQDSYDAGTIDAWACAECGYTELWSRDLDKLEHNPDDGVHLVDTTPQQGQYR